MRRASQVLIALLVVASCSPPDTPPVARGVAHYGLDGRYSLSGDRWRENVDALFVVGATSASVAAELKNQGFAVERVNETTMSASYCWPSGHGFLSVVWIELADGSVERRITSFGNYCEP